MSIIVKTQAELDKIPLDTNEQICIEFGTWNNPAIVKNKYSCSVVARDNSSVVAFDSSFVKAFNNSSVKAFDDSSVEAYNNSSVAAFDSSLIEANENSSIKAYGNVQVVDKLSSEGSIQLLGNAQKIC